MSAHPARRLRRKSVSVFLATVCVARAAASSVMSNDEIAQLLFVGFDGPHVTADLGRMVCDWHVGGVVLYAQNVESAVQTRRLIVEIHRLAAPRMAPFVAIDQEGGLVQRLRTAVPPLPGNMALGATRSPALARAAGRELAASLLALGITVNFAPVLDILSTPRNESLRTRSFSDDSKLVADLGVAFIRGELEGGILPVAKHFPGEGAVPGDSHYSFTTLDAPRETIGRRELLPFRAAIRAGVPALMTSHVAVPALAETPETPTTISERLISGVLRRELRFDGLVITDELQMRAVRERLRVGIGEIAVRAVLAGADMVMVVWDRADREEVYAALRTAYASGRISHDRLAVSLRRIRAAKASIRRAAPPRGTDIAERIARAATTIVRRDGGPLLEPPHATAYLGPDGPLRRSIGAVTWIPTPPRVANVEVSAALAQLQSVKLLIAGIGTSPNDGRLLMLLRQRVPSLRLVVIAMGTPYDVIGISPAPAAVIYTYSSSDASQNAAVEILYHPERATGHLPLHDAAIE